MQLGRKIRDLRLRRGLTVQQLAEASGLSKGFISQVENGHVNPSIGVVTRLAGGVGMPLSALFSAEAPETLVDDLTAATALISAQPAASRKRALRVLRALFDE